MFLLVPLLLTCIAAAVDLRTREIPDALPLAVTAWGVLAVALRWGGSTWGAALAGTLLGLVIGILLFASGGFGGGDAKLVAALGPALGAVGLMWVLLFTGLAGGVLALIAKARRRSTLAYGPAIAVGLAVYVALVCR